LRILIVNDYRGFVGGVESYLERLLPALRKRAHRVAFFYRTEASAGSCAVDGDGGFDAVWRAREFDSTLLEELSAWDPDIVYINEPPSVEWHSALLDRFPVAMFAHCYYGTCVSGRKMHALPHPVACDRRCGPACLALYYPRRCGGLSPLTLIKSYRTERARQMLMHQHRAILVASDHMRADYIRHDVSPDRVHVVPLPQTAVTPDSAPPTPRIANGRLLFLGRLTDLKGADYLLRALVHAERALGKALRLTIAGTGPEESQIRALAGRLHLNVDFKGWLDREACVRELQQTDLLAVPSLWPEPFGLVGIEAGALGIPSVAYATGGIKEWLHPGISGELAESDPPTPEGLAGAIVRALSDSGHYQDLCRGAWEASQRFTMKAHLDGLLPIFERASQERSCIAQ
jgi:glycosyltransferase involved in cell wall biosynthesis